jgi:hypothetical protein
MYFEFNFMNIDAVMTLPDTNQVEMSREKNLTSDNNIKLKMSFTVDTYYPAFRNDRVSDVGYPRDYGSGMVDMNDYVFKGSLSDYFDMLGDDTSSLDTSLGISTGKGGNTGGGNTGGGNTGGGNTGGGNTGGGTTVNTGGGTNAWNGGNVDDVPFGQTGKFIDTKSSTGGSDLLGSQAQEGYIAIPKRSRWYSSILKTRESNRGK